MNKVLFFIVLAFLIGGCAKSNYASAESGGVASENNVTSNCFSALVKSGICYGITWQTDPQNLGGSSFKIQFWQNGVFIDPNGELHIYPYMPAHGHGVRRKVSIKNLNVGEYLVSDVEFSMPGDWEIRIEIREGRNVLDQGAFPVHISE